MIAVLKYPPDYDGELHFTVTREEVTKTFGNLKVSVTLAIRAEESVRDAIRRLGREMAEQPLFIPSEL